MSHHDHDHDHDHDHGHHHSHDHDHGHQHSHSHDTVSTMSTQDKLAKLLDHWVAHNKEHANTYETWAARAEEEGMAEVATLLREAGAMNLGINGKFLEAASKLK